MNIEEVQTWQLKSIADYEEKLLSGDYDIKLTGCITVQSARRFLDKKPRIDIVYGPTIDYSPEKLNQILGVLYNGLTLEKHIENQSIRIQAAKEGFGYGAN